MTNIAITGGAGRMGKAIVRAAFENSAVRLVGALEREDCPLLGRDAGETAGFEKTGVKLTSSHGEAFARADVIIDFSTPEASMRVIEEAVTLGKALVIGTTGFSHSQRDAIKEHSVRIPVVMAPNMSVGVNLLLKLVHDAALAIGSDYDIEIIEAHHRHKKDAPSGTAIRIAEVIAAALKRDLEKVAVYERKGIIGERRPEEIGMQTIRGGDIVGDHTVLLAGPGERIELVHRASSRDTFAVGAVRAAVWVSDKANGLYDMQDVLGFKS